MTPDTLALLEAALPEPSSGILYLLVYRNKAGRLEYRARFYCDKEMLGASATPLTAQHAIRDAILNAQRRLDDPALLEKHRKRRRRRQRRAAAERERQSA